MPGPLVLDSLGMSRVSIEFRLYISIPKILISALPHSCLLICAVRLVFFAKLCPSTTLYLSESHVLFGKKHESSTILHAFCAFCWWCASCSKLTCTNPEKASEGPSRTHGIQRKTEEICPRSLHLDKVESYRIKFCQCHKCHIDVILNAF